MLFLVLQVGDDRYALDVRQIAEVLPLVAVSAIPRAPDGIAGVFEYRGAPVPAVDLSQLIYGRPVTRRLSTRIVVVHHPAETSGTRLLGLVAEKATEVMRRDAADFVDAGLTGDRASYLGPVLTDPRGLVHRLDLSKLLAKPRHHTVSGPLVEDECRWTTSKAS